MHILKHFLFLFPAREEASHLFPLVTKTNINSTTKVPLSIYRLFLSFSPLHVLRAPDPNIKQPYVPVRCPPDTNVSAPIIPDKRSFSTPNELPDVSLLMGETQDRNNDAYHRYIHKHYLAEDRAKGAKKINWKIEDFMGDEYCVENLLHSFGTRSQLGKLTIEHDNNEKIKPAG